MTLLADFEVAITVWTIRTAMVCLVIMFAIRIWFAADKGSQTNARAAKAVEPSKSRAVWLEIAKYAWMLGALFSLLHAMASMGWYHQWSHQLAYEDTAAQTQSLLGVRVGFGIWLNYLFVVLWIVDALWWVASPTSYESRSRILDRIVYGFLMFIAVNGTIVFESGMVRWFGLAATGGLIALWILAGKKSC